MAGKVAKKPEVAKKPVKKQSIASAPKAKKAASESSYALIAHCTPVAVSPTTIATAERLGVPFDDFMAAAAAETPVRRVGVPDDQHIGHRAFRYFGEHCTHGQLGLVRQLVLAFDEVQRELRRPCRLRGQRRTELRVHVLRGRDVGSRSLCIRSRGCIRLVQHNFLVALHNLHISRKCRGLVLVAHFQCRRVDLHRLVAILRESLQRVRRPALCGDRRCGRLRLDGLHAAVGRHAFAGRRW